jgi:hypothetical protein
LPNNLEPVLKMEFEKDKRLIAIRTKYGIKDLDLKLEKVLGVSKIEPDKTEGKKKPKEIHIFDQIDPTNPQQDIDIDIDKIDTELKTLTEKYFNGEINEDEARLKVHLEHVKGIESNYEKRIQDDMNPANFHLALRLKENLREYINYAKSEEFAKASTSYAKTDDNMRVDFGVVISRPPIFLTYHYCLY